MEQVKTISKSKQFLAKKYRVIFHNDNKTTFEFVTFCLMTFFEKSLEESIQLTFCVDKNGSCVAGSGYTKDIAETKKNQVIGMAKIEGFPFQVSVEEE